jgi:uncharacterized protein
MKKRKLRKSLLLFIVFVISVTVIMLDARYWAPKRLRVRFETITSSLIPPSMHNYKILFFSDLHYNNFIDEERTKKIITAINSVNAETVIFGGDLFDHPSEFTITDSVKTQLINLLNNIQAPYGKFAVLGNHDYESAKITESVTNTLVQGNFEVLTNQSIRLHKNSEEFINLIGIDSMSLGVPAITTAFAGTTTDQFNLVVTHAPDLFDQLLTSNADLVLSGHSHGGQVRLPFLSSVYQPYGAEKYIAGKYYESNILMDISNGVGTTKIDVRFNAPAEIIVYRLIYQSK